MQVHSIDKDHSHASFLPLASSLFPHRKTTKRPSQCGNRCIHQRIDEVRIQASGFTSWALGQRKPVAKKLQLLPGRVRPTLLLGPPRLDLRLKERKVDSSRNPHEVCASRRLRSTLETYHAAVAPSQEQLSIRQWQRFAMNNEAESLGSS